MMNFKIENKQFEMISGFISIQSQTYRPLVSPVGLTGIENRFFR